MRQEIVDLTQGIIADLQRIERQLASIDMTDRELSWYMYLLHTYTVVCSAQLEELPNLRGMLELFLKEKGPRNVKLRRER